MRVTPTRSNKPRAPKITVRKTRWSLLSASTQRRLMKMSFGRVGYMFYTTQVMDPVVFIAYYGSKRRRCAWSLWEPKTATAQIYVLGRYRKRGVGSTLLTQVSLHAVQTQGVLPLVASSTPGPGKPFLAKLGRAGLVERNGRAFERRVDAALAKSGFSWSNT